MSKLAPQVHSSSYKLFTDRISPFCLFFYCERPKGMIKYIYSMKGSKSMKDYINNTLSPLLQGDGGYIEFISENNNEIQILARGECSKCHKLELCLKWCEEMIQRDKNREVKLTAVRKKPFFWDK